MQKYKDTDRNEITCQMYNGLENSKISTYIYEV